MKTIIYRADTRGYANHGWLKSHHTFSFANYYNPDRVNFGLLRVVNDDIVAPSMGFGTHPHKDMEIVSIPLKGELSHKDSMNNIHTISTGEVQVMTAGTGITHSEYNGSNVNEVAFLQIWVFPRQNGLKPSYSQRLFNYFEQKNRLTTVVSPDGYSDSLIIQQDAWFNIGNFNSNYEFSYMPQKENNGLFVMVIEGEFDIEAVTLYSKDAIGLSSISGKISIKAKKDNSKLLIIDLPMHLKE